MAPMPPAAFGERRAAIGHRPYIKSAAEQRADHAHHHIIDAPRIDRKFALLIAEDCNPDLPQLKPVRECRHNADAFDRLQIGRDANDSPGAAASK
jgi:hypothetical protein